MSCGRTALVLAFASSTLTGCLGSMGEPPVSPAALANPANPASPAGSAPMQGEIPPNPSVAAPGAGVSSAPSAPSTPSTDDASMIEDDDEALGFVSNPDPSTSPGAAAASLSDAEIDQKYHHDLASLGPASVGAASAGALVNGVRMPEGQLWQLTDAGRAWGTQETVDALVRCIERVNQRLPGAPPISIGHLSAKTGGHLSPHRSHQSGRDADVGYYYRAGVKPFIHATAENLDLPRTWMLVKTAVRETPVEMILIDHAVQRILADYALSAGEDPAFIDEVFQVRGKNARAPIRHVHGHDNHIHFRFHNPAAEAMGRRIARFVVVPRTRETREAPPGTRLASGSPASPGAAPEGPSYTQIRARSGDTLVILARRHGTSVEEIQRANGLSGNAIRAGMTYKIPQKPGAAPSAHATASPRLPKAPARVAARGRKSSAKPALRTPAATKP